MPLGVSVNIKLIDNFSRKLGVINKNLERTAKVSNRANRNFITFGKTLGSVGDKMSNIGSKLTIGATLPILGMGAASLKAASDAFETSQKFGVVFDGINSAAEESAKKLANSYGLSKNESKALLSSTADLLTGFEFSKESALGLSSSVQELAVDLASFTNIEGGAERASKALTKALLGERESVKELGIAILEEDVKAKVKAMEAAGAFTNETMRQKKAMATLQIAISQSKNAIGDYARSSESVANRTRNLMARINDLAVSFGNILLPVAEKALIIFTKVADKLSNMPKSVKVAIVVFGALAAVLGPILLIFGQMAIALGGLMTTLPLLVTFIKTAMIPTMIGLSAAMAPILIVVGKVLLVVGAVIAVFAAWIVIITKLRPILGNLLRPFNDMLNKGINKLEEIFPRLGKFARIFKETVIKNIRFALDMIGKLSDKITGLFGDDEETAGSSSGSAAEAASSPLANAAANVNNINNEINIGIQQDGNGNTQTKVESRNSNSNVRVIDTGTMTPAPMFA